MFRTLKAFLPLMILYYNNISKETENETQTTGKNSELQHMTLNTLDIPID